MKIPEATMRQRAREITEEASKVYGNDLSGCERFLMKKIVNCDKVIKCLRKNNKTDIDDIDICPFPRMLVMHKKEEICCSCEYFFKGDINGYYYCDRESCCGCELIIYETLTIKQAINGLRIFKDEMKKYLEEKQQYSGT